MTQPTPATIAERPTGQLFNVECNYVDGSKTEWINIGVDRVIEALRNALFSTDVVTFKVTPMGVYTGVES